MIDEVKTTGVGSLPFTDSSEALDHVFDNYSIPFYPQLVKHPRYSKLAVPQMLQEVLPTRILKEIISGGRSNFEMTNEEIDDHIRSWPGLDGPDGFISRLKASDKPFFKVQLSGPQTTRAIIEYVTKTSWSEASAQIKTHVMKVVAAFLRRLQHPGKTCIFIWDEANISEPGMGDLLSSMASPTVITGVHICAPFKLDQFVQNAKGSCLSTDINLLSFSDAESAALSTIIHDGGLIAGIVDTQKTTIDPKHVRLLWDKVKKIVAGIGVPENSHFPLIVSGGCGTGLHSVEYERELANMLRAISAR